MGLVAEKWAKHAQPYLITPPCAVLDHYIILKKQHLWASVVLNIEAFLADNTVKCDHLFKKDFFILQTSNFLVFIAVEIESDKSADVDLSNHSLKIWKSVNLPYLLVYCTFTRTVFDFSRSIMHVSSFLHQLSMWSIFLEAWKWTYVLGLKTRWCEKYIMWLFFSKEKYSFHFG